MDIQAAAGRGLVCDRLDFGFGVTHGDAVATKLKHLDVVVVVTYEREREM